MTEPPTNSAPTRLEFYKFFARVLPVYVLFLPIGLAAHVWFGSGSFFISTIALLGGPLGFAFLLAEFGRDAGYLKQNKLWELWGGPPTTQLLRHRHAAGNPVLRKRVHKKLHKLIPEITLPTAEEENADPVTADHIYETCVKYLLARTRDHQRFRLIYKENVSYGFRRNLWGLKPFGVIGSILGILLTAGYCWYSGTVVTAEIAIVLALHIVIVALWGLVVRPSWVRVPADAFASRLLEACDELIA